MQLIYNILLARENYGNIQSMRKAGLIVDAASCSIISMRKICDQETRTTNFRNDFIIYFIDIQLPVNSPRFITSMINGWSNSILIYFIHFLSKPHSHKYLRRIWICNILFKITITIYRYLASYAITRHAYCIMLYKIFIR